MFELEAVVLKNPVALKKLDFLMEQGWEISGVSISKKNPDGSYRHGLITDGGFVGWHQAESQR